MVPLQAKPSLQHGPAALQAPEKPAPQTGVRAGVPHWPGDKHEVPDGQQTLPQFVPLAQNRPTGWEATQLEPLQNVPLGQQAPPQSGVASAQTCAAGAMVQLLPSAAHCPLGQQAVPPAAHGWVPGAQQ